MQFVLAFPVVTREDVRSFLAPSQSNHFVEEVIITCVVASLGPTAVS